MRDFINPPEVFGYGGYSQAVRVRDTIYFTGQVAFDEAGQVVGKGDMRGQVERLLSNMHTVLVAANATMSDLVKLSLYTTDLDELGRSMAPFGKYFRSPFPAMTGVEVKKLSHPDLLVEVDGVAVVET